MENIHHTIQMVAAGWGVSRPHWPTIQMNQSFSKHTNMLTCISFDDRLSIDGWHQHQQEYPVWGG